MERLNGQQYVVFQPTELDYADPTNLNLKLINFQSRVFDNSMYMLG